eukprot:5664712-Pyramimonas_sp.AAC.1
MTGYLNAPKNDLQVICPSRFIACLPANSGPYAALDESVAWSGEWGARGVRTGVEKTQIGDNGDANGKVARWLRPGGWARSVAGQDLDASVFGLDDPHPACTGFVDVGL